MAWLAWLTPGSRRAILGNGVEVGAAGVFEGVWDGDFGAFAPHRSEFAFGSGIVRCSSGRLIFVPPRHTHEFAYVLRHTSTNDAWVSNSLVFALTVGGVEVESPFFREITHSLRSRTDRKSVV
jgi:hypothetical protein